MKTFMKNLVLWIATLTMTATPVLMSAQQPSWLPEQQWVWSDGWVSVAAGGWDSDLAEDGGIATIVWGIVNWILWFLWLIALVILLYGGFLMLTAAGDEGRYKKWFTVVKQAVVGIIFIALSWIIVQLIFWLVTFFTGEGNSTNGINNGG